MNAAEQEARALENRLGARRYFESQNSMFKGLAWSPEDIQKIMRQEPGEVSFEPNRIPLFVFDEYVVDFAKESFVEEEYDPRLLLCKPSAF